MERSSNPNPNNSGSHMVHGFRNQTPDKRDAHKFEKRERDTKNQKDRKREKKECSRKEKQRKK